MITKIKKLTKKEILVFGSGDIFGGGAQLIVNFFYLIFLTDVVKLNPAYAGIIVLISRIWDAVSDPLMGVITDNTKTKYGRRKPYLLAGSFAVIVAFTLLWWPVSFSSQALTFVYVLFAYLFYSTVSTMIMVPYSSMSSEISLDYKERSTVNGTRLFFSQVASLLCAVIPMEIVHMASNVKTGYIILGITFGIFFAIPLFSIFFVCQERAPITDTKNKASFKLFVEPFKIRTFRLLVLIYLFAFFAMDLISSILAYYMKYYLLRIGELNYVLGTMLIVQIAFLPIVVKISNKIGKNKTFMMSASIWIVGAILLGMYSLSWPSWAIYVIAGIIGLGLCGCVVMPWLMFPDVTDVGELYFGERRSGSFGGIMTFMRKSSSAIGIFVISLILQFSGYRKPITQAGKEILQVQPESLIYALRIIVVAIPLLLLGIAIFLASKYPLSRKIHDRLSNYLNYKRGSSEKTDVSENELDNIKKTLF